MNASGSSVLPDSFVQRKETATKQRSFYACLRCKEQKLKCSGNMPCQRCVDRGFTCEFEPKTVALHAEQLQKRESRIVRLETTMLQLRKEVSGIDGPFLSGSDHLCSPSLEAIKSTAHCNNGAIPTSHSLGSLLDSIALSPWCQTEPISARLITEEQGYILMNMILPHFHSHGPILLIPSMPVLRTQHRSFLSVCCATSGQYVVSNSSQAASWLSFDSQAQQVLQAEAHLAQTMLNAHHSLYDILASLVGSLYELRRGIFGQQKWLILGHANQLAVLLRLDQLPRLAARAYLANPAFIPTREQLWGWWLSISTHNQDCLISMNFGLPSPTLFTGEQLQVDFFYRLIQKLRITCPGIMIPASWPLAIEAVAIYDLLQHARACLQLLKKLKQQEQDHNGCVHSWELTSQQIYHILVNLESWHTLWIFADSSRLKELGDSKLRLETLYHHTTLYVASYVLTFPSTQTPTLSPQQEAQLNYCLPRIRTSATAIIDSAPGLLNPEGKLLEPDCYAIAVALSGCMLLRSAVFSARRAVQQSVTVEEARIYARKAVDFLESSDGSFLKLQTELASLVHELSLLVGTNSGAQTWVDGIDSKGFASVRKPFQSVTGWDM